MLYLFVCVRLDDAGQETTDRPQRAAAPTWAATRLLSYDQTLTQPSLSSSRLSYSYLPGSIPAPMATLAKLTSQSTQTLSLLLERQRLQTLSPGPTNSLHLPQIARNLKQLRAGIVKLEEKEGASEAVRLLKSQYERMRGMLGGEADAAGVEPLRCVCMFRSLEAYTKLTRQFLLILCDTLVWMLVCSA